MNKQLFSIKNSLRLAVPALILSFATPTIYAADVFGPPTTVDYQGRLLDAQGAELAPTEPANFKVQFRLYDAISGGNIIWAEEQIITVSKGLFSVRLGEGTPIDTGVGGAKEGSVDHDTVGLPGAFNGKERYLGVKVIIPNQQNGEMSPRLSFLTSPFSFVAGRAQSADRLVQSGSSEPSSLNVGSVSYVPLVLTSSSTLSGGNANILADATTAEVTATLPSGVPGAAGEKKEFTFTKTDASANAVTVQPPAGGTINGGASVTLPLQGDSVTIRNTGGNNWWISSRYNLRAVNAAADGSVTLAGGLTSGGNISATGAVIARSGLPGVNNVNGNGFAFSGTGDGDSGMFSTGDGILQFLTQNTERMRITDIGGIGIGTGTPGATVHIIRKNDVGENEALRLEFPGGGGIHTQFYRGDNGDHYLRSGNSVGRLYLQDIGGGNVIIGGNGVQRGKLHVAGSVSSDNGAFAFYANNGSGGTNTGGNGGAQLYGIYTDNRMAAVEFNAFSDERIKNIQGVSDGASDLTAMMGIEVTDYTFRDTLKNGKAAQKKVVAQQVEKVFPLAVSKSTEVVPDIMKKAEISDGWVELSTDLKKSDKVRLLAGKDTDKLCEVLEVKDGKFRVAFDAAEKEVFVYGREVSDFRSVDYDAIAMLNVSATQEIKKASDTAEEALRKENEVLKAQLAKQDERLAALEKEKAASDVRLAALESALLGKKDSRTVSSKGNSTVINK